MDPYVKMLNLMKKKGAEQNPTTICIAKVIEPPPNIILQTKDLQLYKDDIVISESLVDYKQDISISCSASGGQLQNINIEKQEMKFWEILKVGDEVAVLPTGDNQTWIVLCKVVRL
jgi:hypothetical protein